MGWWACPSGHQSSPAPPLRDPGWKGQREEVSAGVVATYKTPWLPLGLSLSPPSHSRELKNKGVGIPQVDCKDLDALFPLETGERPEETVKFLWVEASAGTHSPRHHPLVPDQHLPEDISPATPREQWNSTTTTSCH